MALNITTDKAGIRSADDLLNHQYHMDMVEWIRNNGYPNLKEKTVHFHFEDVPEDHKKMMRLYAYRLLEGAALTVLEHPETTGIITGRCIDDDSSPTVSWDGAYHAFEEICGEPFLKYKMPSPYRWKTKKETFDDLPEGLVKLVWGCTNPFSIDPIQEGYNFTLPTPDYHETNVFPCGACSQCLAYKAIGYWEKVYDIQPPPPPPPLPKIICDDGTEIEPPINKELGLS